MISKNRIKNIRSLGLKKNRDESGFFVAEGPKVVGDLFSTFTCSYLAALPEWLQKRPIPTHQHPEINEINAEELKKISFLEHPQEVLAVFKKLETTKPPTDTLTCKLSLALDDIQNPGNLGTIIRIADWFGVTDILCSLLTADAYGNKAIQATMGALARVRVHYLDLNAYIETLPKEIPVYGTFLNGQNIYHEELKPYGLIVMGNEGNGISPQIGRLITDRLYIPNFPEGRSTSESLNVAVATAITCAEFRRQAMQKKSTTRSNIL